MRKTIRKYFVPHEENGHAPHFLRAETLLVLIGLLLAAEVLFLAKVFVGGMPGGMFAEILPALLVEEANASRVAEGSMSLAPNPVLADAARRKAEDMAAKGYFAHTSPDGVTPWHWLGEAGYEFAAAGENLAVDFFDSKDVADAWMASPKHRANILSGEFTEIGIGLAAGKHEGKDAVFVVEFFGRPAPAVRIPIAVAAEAPVENPVVPVPPVETDPVPAPPPAVEYVPEMAPVAYDMPAEAPRAVAVRRMPPRGAVQGASFARAVASPRRTMNNLMLALASLVVLAIGAKVAIARHKGYAQNHGLIVNGIVMLVIIASVLILNGYVSFFEMAIA